MQRNPGIAPAHRFLDEEDGEDDWIDKCLAQGMGFKSEEERQAYLDGIGDPLMHPMFASPEDLKSHPLSEAFELVKDDNKSRLEAALMYKDEGNMFVKQGGKDPKHYDTARGKYHESLTFIEKGLAECSCGAGEAQVAAGSVEAAEAAGSAAEVNDAVVEDANAAPKRPVLTEEEKAATLPQLMSLKAQVYCNVALIELTLRNYRQCVENCNSSIAAEPCPTLNRKAYFRKAKALLGLKRYDKGIETCRAALQGSAGLPPSPPSTDGAASSESAADAEMRRLLEQTQREYVAHVQQLNKNNEGVIAANRRREQKYAEAWSILRQVGVLASYAPLDHPSQLKVHHPYFAADEGSASVPRFPVLLLYPQHNKWDVLEGVEALDDMIAQSLVEIFPEPEEEGQRNADWDEHGEYHVSNLAIYVHTHPDFSREVAKAMTSTSPAAPASGSLHGAITSREEWMLSCKVLHEIKTGDSSFVAPLALPIFSDGSVATTAAAVNQSSSREMLRRRRYYEDQLRSEAAHRTSNAHRASSNVLLNVHLGCTFRQIMTAPGVVLPGGLLTLLIYPVIGKGAGGKANVAHSQFLKKCTEDAGYTLKYLNPLGKVQDTPV